MQRSRLVVLLSLCVFAIGFPVTIQAATYFVEQKNSGASDDNTGTESSPWKTIGKAAEIATAGDLVWIKSGIYHENLQVHNAGSYYASEIRFITFAAFANDEVIVDGTRAIPQGEWELKPGTRNVFSCSLTEKPGQVFVDNKRLPEAVRLVSKPKLGRETFEVTDSTPNYWSWDDRAKRLVININDGNPSEKHKVEATVYGVYLDPVTTNKPGLRYEGRGTHGDYIRIRGLRFQRIREIFAAGGFHCLEDCVIREASGPYAVNVTGIVRRNTIVDSFNQALYWPNNSVLEDNLIIGSLRNPTILPEDYTGVLKANGGSYSTVRNNVILDTVRPPAFPEGPPAIWADTWPSYNAIYGNVCLGHFTGIYIEAAANFNVIAYNVCLENHVGIGVRQNVANQFIGNYLAKNDFGASAWDGDRLPGMQANNFAGNWFADNAQAHFWMQDPPDKLGQRMVTLTGNVYGEQKQQRLVIWGSAGAFSDLAKFRQVTGEEATGIKRTPSNKEMEAVKFRLPYSSHRGSLVPMIADARLLRSAPSGTLFGRSYFWRQGSADSSSFGVGVSGPHSPTLGTVISSYPNLPRLWADGGAELKGIEGVRLPAKGKEDQKMLGIKVNGVKPKEMDRLADGWLTPSLPTMGGTAYTVTFRIRGENLKPLSRKDGPIAMAIWTNDTGQEVVNSYLLGGENMKQGQESVPARGNFPWTRISGKVAAPASATRVRFLLGLRRSSGLVAYNDIWIDAE